jgi:hypothetical protein
MGLDRSRDRQKAMPITRDAGKSDDECQMFQLVSRAKPNNILELI